MTPAELIIAVRSSCGKVESDTELEDTDITREGNWILKIIDERIVDKKLRSFTGVANEREYSVHDNTVRVQKVFPYDSYTEDTMFSGSPYGPAISSTGVSENFLFPSLHVIERQRRIRGLPSLRYQWNHIRRKVVIDPAPTQDGDTYWYISIERVGWTLPLLPVDFEDLLVTGTSWKCLSIVLLKRSDLGGIQREGGFVDYPASSLRNYITDKKDDFYDILRRKVQLYGVC